MKSYSNIRVIPVVLVAIFGFAVVKIAGLVIDGSYVFDYNSQPAKSSTQSSWAQEMFNFPGGGKVVDSGDITGSVDEKPKEAGKEDASKNEEAPSPPLPRSRRPSPPEPW